MTTTSIYNALLTAKAQFPKIVKNKTNPHFKNQYADLDSILAAVEPVLHNNGLFISQAVKGCTLVTSIIHAESGSAITSEFPLPEGLDPQKFGSAITYARRYDLCAILSIVADNDDDGNVASQKTAPPTSQPRANKSQPQTSSGGFNDF